MDFKLPDIGEGVHEGEITKWLVAVGDTVESDQPMVEVMTDKATVEIPCPVNGVVKSLSAKEGETIEVGKVLLTIEEGSGASSEPAREPEKEEAPPQAAAREPERQAEAKAETKTPPKEEVLPHNVLATPATRKLARDLSVDLRSVSGTGTNGRITKEDVQLAHEGHQAAAPRASHSAVSGSPSTALAKAPTVQVGREERIALKGIRKKIAESMAKSTHTAAHFTFVEEADMSQVVKLRQEHKSEGAERDVKLTFLPFIIKALIPALKEFPFLNSSLDDEAQEIILKGNYNIGIATDTDNGLIVPVIHDADRKSIWELAAEIQDLSTRARTGKIRMEELRGGTFTITNAGSIGGVFATPVINHPEVAILGVNSIRKRPMVVDDKIVIREMMYLSLSVDHRVVDGADAARFMNRLIYFLSEPKRLVFA